MGVLEPLLECVCASPCVGVRVCIYRMPITFSQLSPQGHFLFTIPPEALPYLRGPLEPLTQSWVRQERERRGLGEEEIALCCVSGL